MDQVGQEGLEGRQEVDLACQSGLEGWKVVLTAARDPTKCVCVCVYVCVCVCMCDATRPTANHERVWSETTSTFHYLDEGKCLIQKTTRYQAKASPAKAYCWFGVAAAFMFCCVFVRYFLFSGEEEKEW